MVAQGVDITSFIAGWKAAIENLEIDVLCRAKPQATGRESHAVVTWLNPGEAIAIIKNGV